MKLRRRSRSSTRTPQRRGLPQARRCARVHARRRGLSLVELLIALAIISALLTATGVALDVSFKAYAIATQSASTQSSTRLLTNRLLTNVRNAISHEPLEMTSAEIAAGAVLVNNNLIQSPFIGFTDRNGDGIRLTWYNGVTNGFSPDGGANELWMRRTPASGASITEQPVLKNVTQCTFSMQREKDGDGIYELRSANFDFTVEAGDDSSLQIEAGNVPPVRVIASTKPRRL